MKKLIFGIIASLVLVCPESSSGQNKIISLVKEVQRKNTLANDKINSLYFEGRAKKYVYMIQKTLGIDDLMVLEDYYFEGIWMKPDS